MTLTFLNYDCTIVMQLTQSGGNSVWIHLFAFHCAGNLGLCPGGGIVFEKVTFFVCSLPA